MVPSNHNLTRMVKRLDDDEREQVAELIRTLSQKDAKSADTGSGHPLWGHGPSPEEAEEDDQSPSYFEAARKGNPDAQI